VQRHAHVPAGVDGAEDESGEGAACVWECGAGACAGPEEVSASGVWDVVDGGGGADCKG